MSNQLCDDPTQGCVGFPTGTGGVPSAAVVCLAGELVVQDTPAAKGWEIAVTQGSGAVIASPGPNSYPSVVTNLVMVNPFNKEALVTVHHELAVSLLIGRTDAWGWYADYSCSGTGCTFLGGGTSGSLALFTSAVYDASDQIFSLLHHNSFFKQYVVPALGTITVSLINRIEGVGISGPTARSVTTYYNTLRAEMHVRVP